MVIRWKLVCNCLVSQSCNYFKSFYHCPKVAHLHFPYAAMVCCWYGSVNGCNDNAVILLHYKGTVILPLMFVTKRVFATKSGALKCEIWYEWPHGRGESRNTHPNWESQWKVSLCCCRGWPKLGELLFCRSGNGTNNSSVMGRITSQYFTLGQDTTWRHPTCPSACPVSIVLPESLMWGDVSPRPPQQQRSSFGRGFRTSIEQTWRTIPTWVKSSYKMLKWKLDKYVVMNVLLCSRA